MSAFISSIAELEACVGTPGLGVRMKIIDHLDATAAAWIAASPLAFFAWADGETPRITLAGDAPGFAQAKDAHTLRLPRAALDAAPAAAGGGAGLLFLAPGVGETLRANGRIAAVDDVAIEITIEECFVHCAKALMRSDFWTSHGADAPDDAAAFVNQARFLALATIDQSGRIDVSPKGDPAGMLIRMAGARATLAERPGNRLAFGYRNIIERPAVAALALIPGVSTIAQVNGAARLTTDEATRHAFIVDARTPILATVIEPAQAALQGSAALARVGLWREAMAPADLDPAATLVAHVKLNKERGAQASALRLAVTRGIVAAGLADDYKKNLY